MWFSRDIKGHHNKIKIEASQRQENELGTALVVVYGTKQYTHPFNK